MRLGRTPPAPQTALKPPSWDLPKAAAWVLSLRVPLWISTRSSLDQQATRRMVPQLAATGRSKPRAMQQVHNATTTTMNERGGDYGRENEYEYDYHDDDDHDHPRPSTSESNSRILGNLRNALMLTPISRTRLEIPGICTIPPRQLVPKAMMSCFWELVGGPAALEAAGARM